MPKCKVNGKEIEVPDGTKLIDAFKIAGEDIAHYCYHPGLSVAGCCRLCMVEIKDNPRLQIACNTIVQEGMEANNNSKQVKDSVKWGLDFHLINHPLDCPICDQAGECQLQIQYMKFGQYDPEMAERKVKKRKVVDLGDRVVLDSERCILCSRCVRFTDEVSKTNELGIFNRGDRSEIGTFDDKPLNNPYSINTVDICPVGALTSKDFRFRQRVWYLKEKQTVCNGCSTGCNIKAYYNEEGVFRVKPVFNESINGYWMCDKGREVYKFVNKENRLTMAQKKTSEGIRVLSASSAIAELTNIWTSSSQPSDVAVVLTGQQTSEEYEAFLSLLVKKGIQQVYYWVNNPESFDDFDGLLIRGDKNPNTKGLLDALSKFKMELPWADLETKLNGGAIKQLIVVAPENTEAFPSLNEKMKLFEKAKRLVWLSSQKTSSLEGWSQDFLAIPMKTYMEKEGTFVNYKGVEQKIQKVTTIVKGALDLVDVSKALGQGDVEQNLLGSDHKEIKTNYFVSGTGGGL